MFDLCQYRNMFGKPGQGVHSYRFMNIAVVDVLLTILGAWLIHRYFIRQLKLDFWQILVLLFVLGIVMHRLFCVNSTINMMIFGPVS